MLLEWALSSIIVIILIIFRDPNVESAGVIIQESVAREEEPTRTIDILIILALLTYMKFTMDFVGVET